MKRTIMLAFGAAIGLSLAPPVPAQAAGSRVVRVVDIDFSPARITVRPGTTVRWDFRDGGIGHNVVSRGRMRFRSSSIRSRGSYRVRFRQPGRYRYVCTLHPGMDGRVVVRTAP
jgi:plastocyanin